MSSILEHGKCEDEHFKKRLDNMKPQLEKLEKTYGEFKFKDYSKENIETLYTTYIANSLSFTDMESKEKEK